MPLLELLELWGDCARSAFSSLACSATAKSRAATSLAELWRFTLSAAQMHPQEAAGPVL